MTSFVRLVYTFISLALQPTSPYKMEYIDSKHNFYTHTRRDAFAKIILPPSAVISASPILASPAFAQKASLTESDLEILFEATGALKSLLQNWERATVDCIYADVPRELLETKNKEQLLQKASEFALFDKSTSVVSCKLTNRIVRDYIGATGKGPLVGIERRLLKKNVIDMVDQDNLDEYFFAVESFSQALSKATALSYTAGTADFASFNNFRKEDDYFNSDGSNLGQAQIAIEEANTWLDKALTLLSSST